MMTLRAALYNAAFVTWTLVVGLLALPLLAGPRRLNAWFGRFWSGVALRLLGAIVGLRHEVRGIENLPRGPAIVALKHQSAWDTLFLTHLLDDPAIVLKEELLRIPVFGWYLGAAGMIAIDRSAGASAMRSLITVAEAAVAEGRPIAIFPEGTRMEVGAALPYHPGVAALYAKLNLPLVPVALNSGLFWPRDGYLTGYLNEKKPGRVIIEILPPIPPGLDRRQVMTMLRERIETATARLVAEGTASSRAALPGESRV